MNARLFVPWTFRTFLGLFVPFVPRTVRTTDFSYVYHPRTFRSVVRILVSSTFLSRVPKVAIKVVGLRREHKHRARLLKRKDDHDDQAAAAADDDDAADNDDDYADDDDDNADADAVDDDVFVCRRRIPTTVRKVRGKDGTKSPQMVRNVCGTKSLVPC